MAPRRIAVSSRFVDFWLLGGASILLWVVMQIGQRFRDRSDAIESHFLQVGAVFSMMAILCNHPHFMISYRFGYGRGRAFVRHHWFSLLAIPLGLVALYTLAYFKFDSEISELPSIVSANAVLAKAGLGFRLGTFQNLGTEILSISVLFMNLTVGWHYSKQVFGCMLVYAKYDRYPISSRQRRLLKLSLFSVAVLNFITLTTYATEYSGTALGRSYFFNIPMIALGLPRLLIPMSAVATGLLAAATLILVFYRNYRRYKVLPSANLVTPWVAFFVWWIPYLRQPEYYFAAVPFFHGLQYLPFAYRMEEGQLRSSKLPEMKRSLFLAALLFIGFCAFELVPGALDSLLQTTWYLKTWFFMVTFAVFINVHHFFIDSVVWKFAQKEVQRGIFE